MRLSLTIICLLLTGIFAQQKGNAFQITALPALHADETNAEELELDLGQVDDSVIKSLPQVMRTPPAPIKPLEKLSEVFEDALSQFPQHRIASLPKMPQESSPIFERSRFQERSMDPSVPASVKTTAPLAKPNQFKKISTSQPTQDVGSLDFPLQPVLPTEPQRFADQPASTSSMGQSIIEHAIPEQAPQQASSFQWQAPTTMAIVPSEQPLSYPLANQAAPTVATSSVLTDESTTWWKTAVLRPFDGSRGTEQVDSNTLVYRALQSSPRIQAVSQNPLIRELQIVEADAEFDAIQFIRSQFEDRVDPVGNQLTVGNGESFLQDNIWSADLGLRKKARTGASWELNQRLGFQNSNSNFFVPQDQGTATLALNVTQPLLRGRGRYFNESQILIAQATNGAAWQTFQAELQDELLGVVSAYWDLYLSRSVYLQKRRNVERGQKILGRLEGRAGLDSLPSQIARARSSVQTRRTELANALRDVRNAETEVRRRIADNSWISGGGLELIPGELPSSLTFQLPLEQVVYSALQHRPEVQEAMTRVRIASVQRDVSANELLPELSLLMGTYVSSLRGDTGILNAFQDQFGQVTPGYSVGINFELPYGNRAAQSRLAQRKLQVTKIRAEVDEVMQTVIAESQVALRRVESASETLVAAEEAIEAAHADRNQFERRWESFALVEGDIADGQNPTNVLDQLLDSQDRLASAELVFVQAERELKVAEVALQRAMGTLLMTQNVGTSRGYESGTPRINIMKDGSPLLPAASNGVPTMSLPTPSHSPSHSPAAAADFYR